MPNQGTVEKVADSRRWDRFQGMNTDFAYFNAWRKVDMNGRADGWVGSEGRNV